MATQTFPLLEPADEDALHYTRLLTVEERPFLRLANRLQTAQPSVINTFPRQLPSPPPEGTDGDIAIADDDADGSESVAAFDFKKQELERRQWRQELLLEFTTIENTLARIQLLRDSNDRERARYAEQKTKILDSAQAVRSNTAELRTQLQRAQQTLALRKEYDSLADSIIANKALRPRDEQHAAMDKLRNEIADLEQEGSEYATTWQERKTNFAKVVAESRQMMNIIKGIKESVEGDDAAEGEEDGLEGELAQDGSTPAHPANPQSRQGTPAPAGTSQSRSGTPASAVKRAQSQSNEINITSAPADDTAMGDTLQAAEPRNESSSDDEGQVPEQMDTT